MNDKEKRRIAEVVAGGIGTHPNIEQDTIIKGLLTYDGNTWWAVMDWVESKGWDWDKDISTWILEDGRGVEFRVNDEYGDHGE